MPVIPANYAAVDIKHSVMDDSHVVFVTLGCLLHGSTPVDAAEAIGTSWAANLMPVLSRDVSLIEVTAEDHDGNIGAAPASVVGGVAVDASPPNVCYLVKKLTGTGGRAGRGRMFLPGVREDGPDGGGVLDPAVQSEIQDACDAFLADFADPTGINLVLLHSPDGAHSADSPLVISQFVATSRVRTQRRRIPR